MNLDGAKPGGVVAVEVTSTVFQMLHLIKAYGDGDNDDAESQGNTEAQGNEQQSRWDILPVVQEMSECSSLLYAQLTALEGQVQAQAQAQARNDLRFCILGRPFIEIVASAIIFRAVGSEQRIRVTKLTQAFQAWKRKPKTRVRVTKLTQAFQAWKRKPKTRILAERLGLEKSALFAKAYKCAKERNGAAHYRTFASFQRGVLEARTLIETDQGYFNHYIPEQTWCTKL